MWRPARQKDHRDPPTDSRGSDLFVGPGSSPARPCSPERTAAPRSARLHMNCPWFRRSFSSHHVVPEDGSLPFQHGNRSLQSLPFAHLAFSMQLCSICPSDSVFRGAGIPAPVLVADPQGYRGRRVHCGAEPPGRRRNPGRRGGDLRAASGSSSRSSRSLGSRS